MATRICFIDSSESCNRNFLTRFQNHVAGKYDWNIKVVDLTSEELEGADLIVVFASQTPWEVILPCLRPKTIVVFNPMKTPYPREEFIMDLGKTDFLSCHNQDKRTEEFVAIICKCLSRRAEMPPAVKVTTGMEALNLQLNQIERPYYDRL